MKLNVNKLRKICLVIYSNVSSYLSISFSAWPKFDHFSCNEFHLLTKDLNQSQLCIYKLTGQLCFCLCSSCSSWLEEQIEACSKWSSPWLKMYLALFSNLLVCLLWPQHFQNFLLVTDSFWEALRGSERLRHKWVCVALRCGLTHSFIVVNKYPDMITSNICAYGKCQGNRQESE